MRSDPRHLLVLGSVSFAGLGLHHLGVLREVVAVVVLAAVAALMVSRTERVE